MSNPIGYVIRATTDKSDGFEPMARTAVEGKPDQLLFRTCFTLYKTEEDARLAIKAMHWHPAFRKATFVISAVFGADAPAPTREKRMEDWHE